MTYRHLPLLILCGLLLTACGGGRRFPAAAWGALSPAPPDLTPVDSNQTFLTPSNACGDHFVVHNLPFATGVRMREIYTYESNGAGLTANDLDRDGDLDLVFASVDREATILWNEGGLRFTPEPLADSFARAARSVDVDGDGWLDLVFTHRGLAGVSFWRNQGAGVQPRFRRTELPGVDGYAYAMAWADLNGDGALDLVTGSYNIDLVQHGIDEPAADPHAGLFYYERQGDGFVAQRLTPDAQTLALGLVDINGDGQLDIWAANGFALPDRVWLRGRPIGPREQQPSWVAAQPFAETSHSTMSIDWGDLANSGQVEFFATDMNPYDISTTNLAAWLPVVAKLDEPRSATDPQRVANALLAPASNGDWRNEATARGVDATGWSWAGKFGDLNNDGLLDLYVVNGMIADNLFGHLANAELVESNQAFRNRGGGSFAPAPEWQLASTRSGRGMIMADLDGDGDLEIVVNNLRSSAQLFENQLCGGASLVVDLYWPGSANSRAIGAQLELHTDEAVYRRDVRASGGYLSGDPVRIHIGFPAGETLRELRIRWPDGAISRLAAPIANTFLEVTR